MRNDFLLGYRACFLLHTATDNDFQVQWHFRKHFSQHKISSTLDIYLEQGFFNVLDSGFSSATSFFCIFLLLLICWQMLHLRIEVHFLVCTCASYTKTYDLTSSDVCTFVFNVCSCQIAFHKTACVTIQEGRPEGEEAAGLGFNDLVQSMSLAE